MTFCIIQKLILKVFTLVLLSKVFLKKLFERVVFNLFQFLEDCVPESHSPTPAAVTPPAPLPQHKSRHLALLKGHRVLPKGNQVGFFSLYIVLETFIFEHTLMELNFPCSNIFETNTFYIFFTAILMKRCSTSIV